MGALIGGIIAVILGVIGIIGWWTYFMDLLKGGIPLLLVLGGAIAIAAGLSDIKDKMEEKREKESAGKKEEDKPEEADKEIKEEQKEAGGVDSEKKAD